MKKMILLVIILLIKQANAQDSTMPFEETVPWNSQDVVLQLNFPETVVIEVWDIPEISLRADVDMQNKDMSISEDFAWKVSSSNNRITIEANFGDRLGNTVVLGNGSDTSNGIDDNMTVTRTVITIFVPRNSKLEVQSYSGSINSDHPGDTLLINANGNVEVNLTPEQQATINASTLMGKLSVASSLKLPVDEATSDSDYRELSRRKTLFDINGGGTETSIISLAGDIRINAKVTRSPFETYARAQKLEAMDRITSFSYKGWRELDNEHLIISTSVSKFYLITLKSSCTQLRFSQAIGINNRGNSLHARFDSIYVPEYPGQRCFIKTIHKMSRAQADEMSKLGSDIRGS